VASKMYDEMIEQSISLKETLKAEKNHMTELSKYFQDFDKIYIVGCGSSLSTGCSVRDALNFVSDKSIDVNTGYEFYYHKKLEKGEGGVILTSPSGETGDTIAALKKAQEYDLHILAVTNEEKVV